MKKKNILIVLISIVIVTSLSCNLPIGDRAVDSSPGPISNESESPSESQNISSYDFSDEQLTLLGEADYPTRFTIIFGENDRQETWFYDTLSYSYVFLNGNFIADKDTFVQYHENMYATTYLPDQFFRGMGLDEILATTGKEEFSITEIEGTGSDLHLLHLEGLSVGLSEGKIIFVETFPAMTERKLNSEDFINSEVYTPTQEELANSGVHEFLVLIHLNGEFVNELEATLELILDNDSLITIENNITNIYRRIEPNKYQSSDGARIVTVNSEGFVLKMEGDNGTLKTYYARLDE